MSRLLRSSWIAAVLFGLPGLAHATAPCPPGTDSQAGLGLVGFVISLVLGAVLCLGLARAMRADKISRRATWTIASVIVLVSVGAGVMIFLQQTLRCAPV